MTVMTLAYAESQLAKWLAASESAAAGEIAMATGAGKNYSVKHNPEEVRRMIDYWQAKVAELTAAAAAPTANTGPTALVNFPD